MNINDVKCKDFEPTLNFDICQNYISTGATTCGFCKVPTNYRCSEDLRDWKKPIPLSHSSVQNHLSCHHYYYLKAVRGIETKPAHLSSALKMGVLWDKVKQYHLGGKVNIGDVINEYEISEYDVAKVRGIYRAYKEFDIQVDEGYDLQAEIKLTIEFPYSSANGEPVQMAIKGFYDRKYATYFAEDKFSGRPDYYLDPFFIESQIGTYFLADPMLEYCIMEIVQVPALKSTHSHKEESAETLEERIFQDVLSRPSHYFIGFNKEKKRYGKKYFRTEFDLDELTNRYKSIFQELYETQMCDRFYKNSRSCKNFLPGIPCEMLPICRYNTMSELVYRIREKPIRF